MNSEYQMWIEISPERWAIEQVRLVAYFLEPTCREEFGIAHALCAACDALNAALISAVAGTDGLDILSKNTRAQLYKYLYEDNSTVPTDDRVRSVSELLQKAKEKGILSLNTKDQMLLERLIETRDRITHIRYETHSIEVDYLLDAIETTTCLVMKLLECNLHRVEEDVLKQCHTSIALIHEHLEELRRK